MNYPSNIEEKLGFDRIREMAKEACLNPLAHNLVNKAGFSTNKSSLTKWLGQVNELKTILTDGSSFDFTEYNDISEALEKLRIKGKRLNVEELHEIRKISAMMMEVKTFIGGQEGIEHLNIITNTIEEELSITKTINKIVSERGELKDDASLELKRLSDKIRVAEASVTRALNSSFKKAKTDGWAAETDITIKDGRYVLPVLAEHKKKVNGIIHDSSGGGKVLYIEPIEVVEVSNKLRELTFEREREVERILLVVTDSLRQHEHLIENYFQKAIVLDFIRAKARVAVQLNATLPHFDDDQPYKLVKAKHPLLFLSLKKEDKEVIPLNLELNDSNRVLIISGPNAGGKSVTLKTIGLLQYMFQCGYLVPADEGSNFKLFKQVFVDIGDDQSIDNNLSTYSSHLKSMKFFTEKANKGTLFLIDELGSGTDPQFGGPIGESILRELLKRQSYGIVTTHFSNLKLLANETNGIINGAMAYNVKELKPLFKLDIGKPGSSFAFEVAENIGLSKKVLGGAKKITGTKQKQIDVLLAELEQDKEEIDKLKRNVADKDKYLSKLIEEYTEIKEALEENKKGILKRAKEEALGVIQGANKQIEQTIKEIKQNKAQKENTKKVREKLTKAKETLSEESKELTPLPKPIKVNTNLKLEVGVVAAVKDKEIQGEIVEIGKRDAVLSIGNIRTTVKVKDLIPIGKPAKQQENKPSSTIVNRESESVSSELDVRGKRGDEAVNEVLDFIDRARLYGWNKLRIVHGRGDGILRKLIRQQLKHYKFISHMGDEHIDFGGDGVTVVEFND